MMGKHPLSFSERIIGWHEQHGRHTLPWQRTRDAYAIWLSEIMLQQTQVRTVIPYYERFLKRFPTVHTLAKAPIEEVMSQWSGLGYYSRARNLHACAQQVMGEHAGRFPCDPHILQTLPGIGRSTAAAIAAFAYGVRAAILDGNVKRVFARVFGIEDDLRLPTVEKALWQRAEALLPEKKIEAYTQGLMDIGATICTRSQPICQTDTTACPLHQQCIALATKRVMVLPTKRLKKPLPEKSTPMWIIHDHHKHHVLLEQRPNKGIWGGLLSLPEGSDVLLPQHLQTSHQILPAFTHTFTHFKLTVTPHYIVLKDKVTWVDHDNKQRWYPVDQLKGAPLPAPVKTVLLRVLSPTLID